MSEPTLISSVPPTPAPPVAAKPSSALTVAALIVGLVAIVCAIIPGLSFIAFLPAITATVLGVIALVRKSSGRGKATAAVVLGPIALLVAIIVSVSTIVGNVTPDVAAGVGTEKPSTQQQADAPAEPEPTLVEGTRDNPAAAGTTVEVSDNSGPIWQITIGAANVNAGEVVAGENQFNPAADAGFQYVLVPVTYTYVGAQTGTPWIDVQIEFVSAAGTTHEQEFAVIPTPITDIGELYPDASATGNLLVMAPSADVEKGTWAVSTFLSEKYFVAVG